MAVFSFSYLETWMLCFFITCKVRFVQENMRPGTILSITKDSILAYDIRSHLQKTIHAYTFWSTFKSHCLFHLALKQPWARTWVWGMSAHGASCCWRSWNRISCFLTPAPHCPWFLVHRPGMKDEPINSSFLSLLIQLLHRV